MLLLAVFSGGFAGALAGRMFQGINSSDNAGFRRHLQRWQWLEDFGFDGDPPRQFLPLQQCQGDCDQDSDCDRGLICFQRDRFDEVPGCRGDLAARTDFCVREEDYNGGTVRPQSISRPSFAPTPDPRCPFGAVAVSRQGDDDEMPFAEYVGDNGEPEDLFPLGMCQGDCDSDWDCECGTFCKPRKRNDPIPGCSINNETWTEIDQKDFCIQSQFSDAPTLSPSVHPASFAPVDLPLAMVVGNEGVPFTAFPLGACQADCDSDDDCKPGLRCEYRTYNELIDGCEIDDMRAIANYDFCVPRTGASESFALRLYWEPGYVWQELTNEQWWCATKDFEGYPGNGKCWKGNVTIPCKSEHFYLAECGRVDYEQQAWRFLPIGDEQGQVLIQSADPRDERCWERSRLNIILMECDINNGFQRWFANNGTSFFDPNNNKFEISLNSKDSHCVSNDHHPKPGELVELFSCESLRAPDSQTAYWMRW